MTSAEYTTLHDRLATRIDSHRLIHDELRTLAFGTDASFYRLIPKLVVKVENEDEVVFVLHEARKLKLPVTFRAAGTSLSGQAISDSVLMMLAPTWTNCRIGVDASTISLQPGVIGAHANTLLAPYGKKIGPDPASIASAMIGGIAANNASGMCCGTAQNSYRTLSSLRIIFGDGIILDSADLESRANFSAKKKELVDGVKRLAERIRNNTTLARRIRDKYRMKNTTGYSLNAFVDFTDPIDIIVHLLIGSEGTLGFISEITYTTVPELADRATSLMMLPTMESACNAVSILKVSCCLDAVEVMDRASLRSVEGKQGMPEFLRSLDEDAAALLVETRASDRERLGIQIDEIMKAMEPVPKLMPVRFTSDPVEAGTLWNIRKGLFPSVGAMRETGTTCIIEDVAFPVSRLAEATLELQSLFRKHGYDEAIIFGHALEGNLHFVFNQDFNRAAEVERYAKFIDDLTAMVVKKYDGALKAEHGTGRNMAPFVELEWGAEAYGIMREIKQLFDPDNLLNPDVIINRDKQAHVKALKPLPAAHHLIDKCIECGFCEIQCPSRHLTLTPRQRIVAYRELIRLSRTGENDALRSVLKSSYDYAGDRTCATDGLCATACPVGIDTGKLIKDVRLRSHSDLAQRVAHLLAGHLDLVTGAMRILLNTADVIHSVLGTSLMEKASLVARRLTANALPLWNKCMPRGTEPVDLRYDDDDRSGLRVVYFPTCINRTMGYTRDGGEKESVPAKTYALLRKAGLTVIVPENLANLCCGMAFDSKGFQVQGMNKAKELEAALLKASNNGEYPVYVDMSPCLYRMKETLDARLQLFEPIEFILTFVAERLEFRKLKETVAIHSTCSSTKMGLGDNFKKLAEMCAEKVVVPAGVGCCGWAGDRGFTYPELNESALADLKKAIPDDCRHGYSTSRTCEIGLSLRSGISYTSIVYLVDRCTEHRRQYGPH